MHEFKIPLMYLFETFTLRLLLLKSSLYIRILFIAVKLHNILRIFNWFLCVVNRFLWNALILHFKMLIVCTLSKRVYLKLIQILIDCLLGWDIFKLVDWVLINKLLWRFLQWKFFAHIFLSFLLLYEAIVFFQPVGISQIF